jgi:hypothetical protein
MTEFEYIEDRPETWTYHTPPAYPREFQDGLVRIAGLNRHGKPNLKLVWGGTAISEKTEKPSLKYLAGHSTGVLDGYNCIKDGDVTFVTSLGDAPEGSLVVPATKSEPLGLLRWVIEKWTSPEELEDTLRFRNRYLPGEIEPVLREFPREGVYDTFLVVENKEGKFRHVDEQVLGVVKMMWNYQLKPFHERQADDQRTEDLEKEQREKQEAEEWRAVWNLDLKLDKEEKERRTEYWARYAHELRNVTDNQ